MQHEYSLRTGLVQYLAKRNSVFSHILTLLLKNRRKRTNETFYNRNNNNLRYVYVKVFKVDCIQKFLYLLATFHF